MKRYLLLTLALCLALAACGDTHHTDSAPAEDGASASQGEAALPLDTAEPAEGAGQGGFQKPVELGALTVEVVVPSEEAEGFLTLLGDLSALLDQGLSENGFDAESVTVTISTAGGSTADALAAGGVDAALLPAEDFLLHEGAASGVLMDGGELPSDVAAVTAAKAELDSTFQKALAAALTAGGEGSFLSLCRPGADYVPFDSEALQPLREQLAEASSQGGGTMPR